MSVTKQTYVYKTASGVEIKADVHRQDDDAVRPVIVWIHGGALVGGNRGNIKATQRDLYINAGYAIVSIDYRLAPETKLAAIIEDIQDAFHWVRAEGPSRLRIDPERLAVIGHSAGGYLTLMSGFCVNPRPQALVSFYGYGDITERWYSHPDLFYLQSPAVPKEEAYAAVGQSVISTDEGTQNRFRFYLYCRQQGIWPNEVGGHDPVTEPRWFDPYCPIRNVTAEYPPTLLLHGDRDTDVPYQQSVEMAEELARVGVEHELITVLDGPHGFDGADKPEVAAMMQRVLGFLKQHLG